MNSYARTTTAAKLRFNNLALALCWAALACCRITGIDMHVLTAGPAFAPRPAAFAVVRRQPLLG